MEKQTAVDWLEDKVYNIMNYYGGQALSFYIQEAFEQAKEMEKQEIIDAYDCGKEQPLSSQLSPIEYYNETFGGNNEQ